MGKITYANSKISIVFTPFLVFFVIFIPSYLFNKQKVDTNLFYLAIFMFLVVLLHILRQRSIFELSENSFTIQFPFKYLYKKRQYHFKLNDIVSITFIDPIDGRMAPAKIDVFYRYNNSIKMTSLAHDLNLKKMTLLIKNLRDKDIDVKTKI